MLWGYDVGIFIKFWMFLVKTSKLCRKMPKVFVGLGSVVSLAAQITKPWRSTDLWILKLSMFKGDAFRKCCMHYIEQIANYATIKYRYCTLVLTAVAIENKILQLANANRWTVVWITDSLSHESQCCVPLFSHWPVLMLGYLWWVNSWLNRKDYMFNFSYRISNGRTCSFYSFFGQLLLLQFTISRLLYFWISWS